MTNGNSIAAHSEELRKALELYLAHARRAGGTARSAARSRRGSAADTAKVREWAKRRGIEVSTALVRDHPTVPAYQANLATSLNFLGLVYVQLKRYPEAESTYERALAVREKLTAAAPG